MGMDPTLKLVAHRLAGTACMLPALLSLAERGTLVSGLDRGSETDQIEAQNVRSSALGVCPSIQP
jgi:hypothetical protein